METDFQTRDAGLQKIVRANCLSFVPWSSEDEAGVGVSCSHNGIGEIVVNKHTGELTKDIAKTGHESVDDVLEYIRLYLQIERDAYCGHAFYQQQHNGDRALYVLYDADNDQ